MKDAPTFKEIARTLVKEFEAEQISIIAGSVDSAEKASETVEKNGITFPIAYGIHAEEASGITGAYYDKNRQYVHATGFLVRPDNTLEVVCCSSGPIGRFVAQDLLNLVKFYKNKKTSSKAPNKKGAVSFLTLKA